MSEITDHSKCSCSTGLEGEITAGQGKLDWCGYFEFPCKECTKKLEKEINFKYPSLVSTTPF